MNLKSIAEKWLKDNGYDGLCNPDGECGCYFDDFMPCSEPGMDCQAGHKGKAPDGLGVDYFIYPGKANKLKEVPDEELCGHEDRSWFKKPCPKCGKEE